MPRQYNYNFIFWQRSRTASHDSLTCVIIQAELSLGTADRIAYVGSPASDFQKESDVSAASQFHARYVNGTLYRKLR